MPRATRTACWLYAVKRHAASPHCGRIHLAGDKIGLLHSHNTSASFCFTSPHCSSRQRGRGSSRQRGSLAFEAGLCQRCAAPAQKAMGMKIFEREGLCNGGLTLDHLAVALSRVGQRPHLDLHLALQRHAIEQVAPLRLVICSRPTTQWWARMRKPAPLPTTHQEVNNSSDHHQPAQTPRVEGQPSQDS